MKKELLLVRSYLHKAKGQTVAIVVLMLLAAVMLHLWLMLSLDYKQNFDRRHDELHAEHVILVVDEEAKGEAALRSFLSETLEADTRTAETFLKPALHMVGKFNYQGGEINSELVILEKEAALQAPIGRVEIVEEWEGKDGVKSGIYLPLLYQSEDIALGKTISIWIGSERLTYTVCGFFNSMMAGSHNCTICEILLTEDQYQKLEESGYAPGATFCAVRLWEKGESENYESSLKSAVSARYPTARMVSNSYTLVTSSRYISQMICAGVISAMAFLILLIALVVIASNILYYIQENMKNLGTLKAIGYTGRQLISSLLLQFLGVSLLSALAGIGISYGLFPFVNTMMISQTGIPYELRFLPVPFLLTLVLLGGAVVLVVVCSAWRIGRIEPIVALRQGLLTHNFRKNHVPLDRGRLPILIALALKNTCSGLKHTITVCITMLVLSLVVVFSGVMAENMILDMTPFLNMIVGETADSCINVNVGAEEALLEKLEADWQVEKSYLYHSLTVSEVGGLDLMATISDDFSRVNNQNVVLEGRFPKYENEMAIAAKYAKERGLQIGDEIWISTGGSKANYLISGFTQVTNNLGKDCLMTKEGYERLGELQNVSYYLNLAEGTDIEQFHKEIKEEFERDVNMTINIKTTIEGASAVYISLMTIIVLAILVLSMIVIVFVLYLLVRLMLGRKKQEYGILKALGFTSRQLLLLTALSFLPAMIGATVVGLVVSSILINPLIALFLEGIGIVKCTFFVPVGFVVTAGVGLVLFAFAVACLLSWRVKRISPKMLLAG